MTHRLATIYYVADRGQTDRRNTIA